MEETTDQIWPDWNDLSADERTLFSRCQELNSQLDQYLQQDFDGVSEDVEADVTDKLSDAIVNFTEAIQAASIFAAGPGPSTSEPSRMTQLRSPAQTPVSTAMGGPASGSPEPYEEVDMLARTHHRTGSVPRDRATTSKRERRPLAYRDGGQRAQQKENKPSPQLPVERAPENDRIGQIRDDSDASGLDRKDA